jgi:hypothetical protein
MPSENSPEMRRREENARKNKNGSRAMSGGEGQLKRDLKTNKPANKGYGPIYEAGTREELARQARKFALKKYGVKSKQYKSTMPKDPDSIIKRKGM